MFIIIIISVIKSFFLLKMQKKRHCDDKKVMNVRKKSQFGNSKVEPQLLHPLQQLWFLNNSFDKAYFKVLDVYKADKLR